MSTEVEVSVLPPCDVCLGYGKYKAALYDGKTSFGPWANMCQEHFDDWGLGLGTGVGQRFVLLKEE